MAAAQGKPPAPLNSVAAEAAGLGTPQRPTAPGRIGVVTDSPQTRHAHRSDVREPVGRMLADRGRDSRGEGFVSPDMAAADMGAAGWQASFASGPSGDPMQQLSPSLPPCNSPLDCAGGAGLHGMIPIRSEIGGERRGSRGGAMFGGSLVEPASLLGGVSPNCSAAEATSSGARRGQPLNGSPQPGGGVTPGLSGKGSSGGTPLPPPDFGTPTRQDGTGVA
eukprot:TRINITY_DN70224_c0_g1_i1.p2 TRINITY_DN70224_c0_g1~~TRINITY_DN70224_c0_g1_i1.p2  ORF type:complete len:221 (+),score=49.20 TRINITY_DN70224_c0_g1_i1:105-767(+)